MTESVQEQEPARGADFAAQANLDEDLGVSIRKLIDAGVHFGHQTKRWNPKMRPVHLRRAQRHPHRRPRSDRTLS